MLGAEDSAGELIKSRFVVLSFASLLIAAIAAAGTLIAAAPQPAQATPAFAGQTGFACGQCHTSPSGGVLNDYGKAFKANGDKVPKGK